MTSEISYVFSATEKAWVLKSKSYTFREEPTFSRNNHDRLKMFPDKMSSFREQNCRDISQGR